MSSKKSEFSVIQYFTLNFPGDWDEVREDWAYVRRSPRPAGVAPTVLMGARNMRLLLDAIDVRLKAKSDQEVPQHWRKADWDRLVKGGAGCSMPPLHERVLAPVDREVVAEVLAAMSPEDFSDKAVVMAKFAQEFEELKVKLLKLLRGFESHASKLAA